MLKFTLPDFTNGLARNLFFIRLAQEHPECFVDDLKIESVYGCFPSCVMNGGRAFIKERYSSQQIEETFVLLAEHQVTTRLTFTNMLAGKEHLAEPYTASMLDIASQYPVEVIVYSDEVAACLKERYGFTCILSTTHEITDVTALNQMTKRYDFVVLNYNKNKDHDFIRRIEDPGRVEVMVNEFCQYQCPRREAHYLHNSEDQMSNTARPFPCAHQDNGAFFKHAPGHPVYLTVDEVRQMYVEYNIECFKVVGRGIPQETVLESYAYYLLRPEYREPVKQLVRRTLHFPQSK